MNNREADVALTLFMTDWEALKPESGESAGVLTFLMAKDKWG